MIADQTYSPDSNMGVQYERTLEDSFDELIMDHFTGFSGSGDVVQWLNETEQKFTAHRQAILTFDDFYEFLMNTFDRTVSSSSKPEDADLTS